MALRHRVTGTTQGSSVNRFVGSFAQDPFSFQTLINVTVTDKGSASPEAGMVRIDRAGGDRIVAHTADGCRWMLRVQGNTANCSTRALKVAGSVPARCRCATGRSSPTTGGTSVASDPGTRS